MNGRRHENHQATQGPRGLRKSRIAGVGRVLQRCLCEAFEPRLLLSATDVTAPAGAGLATVAYQNVAITIPYTQLLHDSGAVDAGGHAIAFLISRVSLATGYLYLKHGSTTAAVTTAPVTMLPGDALGWVPLAPGVVPAFTARAGDYLNYADQTTAIYISTKAVPTVSATATSPEAWEANSAHQGTITVTRSGDTSAPLSLTVVPINNNPSQTAGGAKLGTNYTMTGPGGAISSVYTALPVTIPAGQASVVFTVTAVEDNATAPALQQAGLLILHDTHTTAPSYAPDGAAWSAGVNILDSSPTISIAPAGASIQEGVAGASAFVITRTAAPGGTLDNVTTNVQLNYTASTFMTALHMVAPPVASFAPGETRKVIQVVTTDDGTADATQTVVAAISGSNFIVSGSKTATINILDGSPTISIASAGSSLAEGFPTQAAFVLTRTAAPGRTLDTQSFVNVSYTGSTFAIASLVGAPPVVFFDVGQATQTVFLTPADDGTADGNQTIQAAISGSNLNFSGSKTASVTVTDSSPVITIAASSTAIPEGSPNQIAFTLTRTPAKGKNLDGVETFVNVNYAGTGSTFAVAGHLTAPPVAYFAPGETTKQIVVSTTDDSTADGNQAIAATISGTGFNVSGSKTASVTVSDSSPLVSIASAGATVTEGLANQPAFVLTRTAAPGKSLAGVETFVQLSYTGSTFLAAAHLIAPPVAYFAPGQTTVGVVISTTDDGSADGTQTIVAAMGGAGYNVSGNKTASTNITDGSATLSIVATSATAVEATRAPGQFLISRSGSTAAPLDVNFTVGTAAANAVRGVGYTLTYSNGDGIGGNVITIPAGATSVAVNVVPIDNGINSATTVPLTLTANGKLYNLPTTASATVTITNNARTPVVNNATANRVGARDTPIEMSFDTLLGMTGAQLAPGSNGPLQLRVGTVSVGTLMVRTSSTAGPATAGANTVLSAGSILIWTPPLSTAVDTLTAFTLFALDGTVASTTSTAVVMTVL